MGSVAPEQLKEDKDTLPPGGWIHSTPISNHFNLQQYIKQPLYVVWRDAHHYNPDWYDIDDLEPPNSIIHSVGFLVKEDKNHIILAMSANYLDDMVGTVFAITKAQIITMRKLTP